MMKRFKYVYIVVLLFLYVLPALGTSLPESYKARKKEAIRQLRALIVQNAKNDAKGQSHLNQYIFTDIEIRGGEEGKKLVYDHYSPKLIDELNAKLSEFHNNNKAKIYVYLSAFKARTKASGSFETYAIEKGKDDDQGLSYTKVSEVDEISLEQMKKYETRLAYEVSQKIQLKNNGVLLKYTKYLDLAGESKNMKGFFTCKAGANYTHNQKYFHNYFSDEFKRLEKISNSQEKSRLRLRSFIESAIHCFETPLSRNWSSEYTLNRSYRAEASWVSGSKKEGEVKKEQVIEGKDNIVVWNYTNMEASNIKLRLRYIDNYVKNFSDKIKIVITNKDSEENLLSAIKSQQGFFKLNSREMLIHFHLVNESKIHVAVFYGSQLQSIRAQTDWMKFILNDLIGRPIGEIAAAIHYCTLMLKDALNAITIPEKYWNPNHQDYIKEFAWAVSILMGDFINNDKDIMTLKFALFCGIWNGIVKSVQDVNQMVELVSGFIAKKEIRDSLTQSIDMIKEKGLLNLIKEQFGRHIDDLSKLNHKSAYLLGEDIVFIASFFIGVGEVAAVARTGNLAKGLVNFAKFGNTVTKLTSKTFLVIKRGIGLGKQFVKISRNAAKNIIEIVAKNSKDIIAQFKNGRWEINKWIDIRGNIRKGKEYGKISDNVEQSASAAKKYIARNDDGELGFCLEDGTCFVAGTPIFTANKTFKGIEAITVGQKVYAANPKNCQVAVKPVETTFVRTSHQLIRLGFANEIIYATNEHPFFNLHHQQILAENLRAGDTLKTFDGYAILKHTRLIDTITTVYNFHVKDFMTYYVGKTKLLVHNMASHFKFTQNVQSKIDELGLSSKELTALTSDMTKPNFKEAIEKNAELLEGWQLMNDLGEELARKSTSVLENMNKVIKNNDLKNLGLDKHKLKEALEQRIDDIEWETPNEFNEMLSSMLPPNKNSVVVGEIIGRTDVLIYRFMPSYNEFIQKSGVLKGKIGDNNIVPAIWKDKSGYEELLKFKDKSLTSMDGYQVGIDLYKRDFNKKVAFGLDNGLEAFAQDGNKMIYLNSDGAPRNFFDRGYCQVSDGIKHWREMFFQTVVNLRANGGNIHFKLDGIDKTKVKIWENPDIILSKDQDPSRVFSFTNFEIRQIVRNKDWFKNTTWYFENAEISGADLKNKFGIEPLFK